MVELTTKYDFSKLSPFEIKWKDVSFYLQKQTGRSEIPTRGYTIFYTSETQIPKSIVIFVYGYYSKKEYGQIDGVNYLEFYKGEYRVRETLGALGQYFLFDSLSADEPLIFCPCFNPFDPEGNLELYDEYSFAVVPTVDDDVIYHQVQNRINNQTNVRGEAFACRLYIPSNAPFIQEQQAQENSFVTNLAGNGNFSNAILNLPIKNYGSKYQLLAGQIRDLVTPITSNIYYNFSSNATFYGYSAMKDILDVTPFRIFDDTYYMLEGLPRNYLSLNAYTSTIIPDFKAITIRIDGCTAIRNKSIIISFAAINFDVNKLANLQINLWWREFNGEDFNREGQFDTDTITLTADWAKYTAVVKQPLPATQDQITVIEDTFVEVQLRVPNNAEFQMGITNLLVDYGTSEITYPRTEDFNIRAKPTSLNQPVIWTNSGLMPLTERPGSIIPRLTASDSETTLFADGRMIYADDVYEFNEIDADGFNIGPTISTPFSKPNGKGLYDFLVANGYPDGSGDDYVTYSDLTSGIYASDATELGISGIFEFRKPKFNPVFTVSGSGQAFTATPFHTGQDYAQDFWYKAYIEKDNKDNLWFGANSDNYLAEFARNGGKPDLFSQNNTEQYTAITLNNDSTINVGFNLLTTGISRKSKPQISGFPVNFISDNTTSKTIQFQNTLSTNYGRINATLIDTQESEVYSTNNNLGTTPTALANTITILSTNMPELSVSGTLFTGGVAAIISSSLLMQSVSGALPTTNPSFSVLPNTKSVKGAAIDLVSKLIANDTPVKVFYQDPKSNVSSAVGTNLAAKRVLLPTMVKNVFGVKFTLISNSIVDYKNLYFLFECDATRDYKVKSFTGGKSKNEIVNEADGKFCFYFYTGSETRPSGIGADYRAIPIDITNATTASQISKILETTVNTYRIALPDLRGTVLRGNGISEFEDFIEKSKPNAVTIPDAKVVLCKNLRNQGYKIPRNIIYNYTSEFGYQAVDNVHHETLSDLSISPNSSFLNQAIVSYHVTVC